MRAGTFLEQSADIFHELIVIEENADGSLQFFDFILLKQQVMTLASGDALLWRACRGSVLTSDLQGPHSLNYQLSGKVAADQADHLLVIESCYDFVVWCRMKDLLDLLQE